MIFLDSTILIDYLNGANTRQVEILESILGKEFIAIGDYVLTEVLQGFKSDNDFQTAKNTLLLFPCFEIGGKAIAIQSAKNYRYLRKKGITIRKTIDTMIATFCIENNLTLFHNDRDFDPFVTHLNLNVLDY